MKKIFFATLIAMSSLSLFNLNAQTNSVQSGQNQSGSQDVVASATLKSASRLFATRDDLTSVILIIPADSMVDVLGIDSTYLHVVYQDNEGFIFRRQAVIDRQVAKKQLASAGSQSGNEPQDRFTYLENKYGTNMANKLIAGKIWKGMNAEMANDSWGTADKINRIISGNIVKEEWIFRSTWLYFENNTLLEWGPVTKR
jgi:16S rRNA C1402 N4-methylase RsmH